MVCCSAIGCSNRGEQGFSMVHFPREPNRRLQWIINTGRANWTPTHSNVLCEVHFPSHMWEKPRVDGKKKLKCSAVPTIFPICTKKTKQILSLRKLQPAGLLDSLHSRTEDKKVVTTPKDDVRKLEIYIPCEEEEPLSTPKKRKRFSSRFVYDATEEDVSTLKRASRFLKIAKQTVMKKDEKIKNLRETCRRLKRENFKMKVLYDTLTCSGSYQSIP